jgi:TonB family protein
LRHSSHRAKVLLSALIACAAPLAEAQTMSRFEAACVRSVLRHGTVTNADEVRSACRCAESALDRNGIGESVRTTKNMYVTVQGDEFFEFYAPRYLWNGNGEYAYADYPWRMSEAERGSQRADHRQGATQAQACLSPKYMPQNFFIGSRVAKTPVDASTPAARPRAELVTASPEALEGLKTLRLANRGIKLDYPAASTRAREQGQVIFAIKLDADGRVARYTLVSNPSGSDRLAVAATKAVAVARFGPGQETTGEFDGKLIIDFALPPEPVAPPDAG